MPHADMSKRFTQWAPGDVHGERIDKDIPLAALGGLQWRA